MERQLVGDLEHEGEPDFNETDSDQHSCQTNELIEGYEEANMSPRSDFNSFLDRDGGSIFNNQYRRLSRAGTMKRDEFL